MLAPAKEETRKKTTIAHTAQFWTGERATRDGDHDSGAEWHIPDGDGCADGDIGRIEVCETRRLWVRGMGKASRGEEQEERGVEHVDEVDIIPVLGTSASFIFPNSS